MSLGQKTFAIVFLSVLGLTVGLYAATRFLMLRSFLRLEDSQARNAIERVHNALNDDISGLAATTNDYAAWDRTYGFMQHPYPNYIHQEFQNDTLQGLSINSVLLLDTAGKIVFFKRYDLIQQREITVPFAEQAAFASNPWIARAQHASSAAYGIMSMPGGPVLIAACPILTTRRQGPVRGVLVMTQNLDQRRIERLKTKTRSSITIVSSSTALPPDRSRLPISVRALNSETVTASETLNDIQGQPILELNLQARRTVFQQGVESLHYFLGALCIASIAFGTVSLLLLRYVVLARVTHLSEDVRRIGDSKKLSERVMAQGNDELGLLGATINTMLEALQNSETQFHNVAENIHQVFWVESAHTGKLEYLSMAYESVWGQSREEVFRNPMAWAEAIYPNDRELVADMRQQQKRGKIGAAEFRIVRPNGDVRWIHSRYFPVPDEQGRLRQIAGLAEDITEFKQAEEVLLRSQEDLERLVEERTVELAAANEALREKEEHFRQLFATIPLPVCLCSEASHRFLEVNEAAIAQYGYSREEFLAMSLEDIRPPQEIEQLGEDLAKLNSARTFTKGRKHRVKDGRLIDVEVSAQRVHFTGVPSVLIATYDVTERMRMEVELRHGQKLQAVGELAAGVAHEINTPIQFVGNNAEFLQGAAPRLMDLLDKHEEAYDTVRAHCTVAMSQKIDAAREAADLPFLRREIPTALAQTSDGVQRVATIVQALKRFSHVESDTEKAAANLNEALESTLIVAGNELKYVSDVKTAYGDLPLVKCYLGDLNQVFLNLLVNAAHSIADVVKVTGGRGQITVETKTEDEWAVVAISDTGAGIPLDIRPRIFDPFFTTKAVGKGTGQGLALARAIVVEKHGGTLTFETEMGKGTTFYIRIPLLATGVAKSEAELTT